MHTSTQLEQHALLRQLVGEWNVSGKLIMEPDGVAEGTADGDGQPFVSIMTLGYDPSKDAFVGAWIETMQTTMWSYLGQLDESKRVLTLEAGGPSMADPSTTTRYRDQIELISQDAKRTTSRCSEEMAAGRRS